MVSRQNRRPKRCSTHASDGAASSAAAAPARRPGPGRGLLGVADHAAERGLDLRAKGGGRRCAGRPPRRGRRCCRRGPTASRSADAARSAPPRPSRWSPNSSRTAPGSAPGSAHATNSPPAHEAHPAAGPTGHNQLATSLRLLLHRYQLSHSQTPCGRPKTLPQGHHPANLTVTFYDFQTGRGLSPRIRVFLNFLQEAFAHPPWLGEDSKRITGPPSDWGSGRHGQL